MVGVRLQNGHVTVLQQVEKNTVAFIQKHNQLQGGKSSFISIRLVKNLEQFRPQRLKGEQFEWTKMAYRTHQKLNCIILFVFVHILFLHVCLCSDLALAEGDCAHLFRKFHDLCKLIEVGSRIGSRRKHKNERCGGRRLFKHRRQV